MIKSKEKTNQDFHIQPPCNVLLYNDDRTLFEYVIVVLITVFNYSIEEATAKTMQIHNGTRAVVATLPLEEAYAKVDMIEKMNEECGQGLQADVEIN